MTAAVGRRLLAEFTGTGLLVAVVAGLGIAVTRLTGDGALQLLASSLVTALGLAVLIVVLIPAGARTSTRLSPRRTGSRAAAPRTAMAWGQATAVMACQVAGAIAGAALADAMFAEPILSPSQHHRGGAPILLSEVVATAGLLFVIISLVRSGRTQHMAWAVGAWIGAASWFTASTSFANPAATIGRALTNTYAGIAPVSAPAFIAAQLVGGAIGTVLAITIHPARPDGTEIGLDLSHEYPKPLTTGKVHAAEVVITMGCGDACPVYPGKRYLDWDLPDPAGLTVEQVRPIRDDIGRRVQLGQAHSKAKLFDRREACSETSFGEFQANTLPMRLRPSIFGQVGAQLRPANVSHQLRAIIAGNATCD